MTVHELCATVRDAFVDAGRACWASPWFRLLIYFDAAVLAVAGIVIFVAGKAGLLH